MLASGDGLGRAKKVYREAMAERIMGGLRKGRASRWGSEVAPWRGRERRAGM